MKSANSSASTIYIQNSIALGESTLHPIYPEQHQTKVGLKLHKYGLKQPLPVLDGRFR